jgi:hypothetical protein
MRILSDSQTTRTAIRPDEPPKTRTNVSEHTNSTTQDAETNGKTNGHVAPGNADPSSLAALIQEAEALHETLSDARTRAGKLIVALRRYRRRERLVASTLASLKQLKLSEVAE